MEITEMPGTLIGWGALALAFCVSVYAWRRRWKMAFWYDITGTVLIVIAGMHFNVGSRIVVSVGLAMTALFSLMEFKRMHPKRKRYAL